MKSTITIASMILVSFSSKAQFSIVTNSVTLRYGVVPDNGQLTSGFAALAITEITSSSVSFSPASTGDTSSGVRIAQDAAVAVFPGGISADFVSPQSPPGSPIPPRCPEGPAAAIPGSSGMVFADGSGGIGLDIGINARTRNGTDFTNISEPVARTFCCSETFSKSAVASGSTEATFLSGSADGVTMILQLRASVRTSFLGQPCPTSSLVQPPFAPPHPAPIASLLIETPSGSQVLGLSSPIADSEQSGPISVIASRGVPPGITALNFNDSGEAFIPFSEPGTYRMSGSVYPQSGDDVVPGDVSGPLGDPDGIVDFHDLQRVIDTLPVAGELVIDAAIDFNGDFLVTEADLVEFRTNFYCPSPDACVADQNLNGEVDVLDFNTFFNNFNNASILADADCDGVVSTLDFSAFLSLFEAGCP